MAGTLRNSATPLGTSTSRPPGITTRKNIKIAPAISGSLASILYRARKRWAFVDLSNPRLDPGFDWMDASVVAKTWGVNPLTLKPREQYDGLLFVHTTTTPEYLPRAPFGPG